MYLNRFWFFRDGEGSFCPQVVLEIKGTRWTLPFSIGFCFDDLSKHIWFTSHNPHNHLAAHQFHWYLGGSWSGGIRWPTVSNWTDETGINPRPIGSY